MIIGQEVVIKNPQYYQMASSKFLLLLEIWLLYLHSCMHALNEAIPQKLEVPSSYSVSYRQLFPAGKSGQVFTFQKVGHQPSPPSSLSAHSLFMKVTQLFKLGGYLDTSQIIMYGGFEIVLRQFKGCLRSLKSYKHIYMPVALKHLGAWRIFIRSSRVKG